MFDESSVSRTITRAYFPSAQPLSVSTGSSFPSAKRVLPVNKSTDDRSSFTRSGGKGDRGTDDLCAYIFIEKIGSQKIREIDGTQQRNDRWKSL